MKRAFLIAAAMALSGCQRYNTQERAAGQPTMNELMHRRVNEQQKMNAEYTLRLDRAKRLTAPEVAQLEAKLRTAPNDEDIHTLLYLHYLLKKDAPNQSRHVLWSMQHPWKTQLVPINPEIDAALDPVGFQAGKRILLARLNTADDYARAARFLSSGDKREAERILQEGIRKFPDARLQASLGWLWANVLLGAQGVPTYGVIKNVSLADAHGTHAQEVRKQLDVSRDPVLLMGVARVLLNANRLYPTLIDFDPVQLGRAYWERAARVAPDSTVVRSAARTFRQIDAYERLTPVLRSGKKVEQILLEAPEQDRWYLLPRAADRAASRKDWAAADDHAREYLHLAKRNPDHPEAAYATYYGNMMLGHIALRQGDRGRAAAHLLASVRDLPNAESFRYERKDMTLARQLTDWGEREAVAAFLEACAKVSPPNSEYAKWAADIRKGINPDLIPYSQCTLGVCV
jgi:TolA-binding protein